MSRLVTLNEVEDEEILNELFGDEITVFEDIQGSKIWVNWNGKEFTIKPKSLKKERLAFRIGQLDVQRIKPPFFRKRCSSIFSLLIKDLVGLIKTIIFAKTINPKSIFLVI